MPRLRLGRLAYVSAIAAVTSVAAGGSGNVFAHIDPDPPEAPAGSTQSVGFTVEHGCDGSPTVQLDMRLADGVSAAAAEPIDGWTSSITDNVLTFAGGPLPDDTPLTFRIRMTLPNTPGATIFFPFVQRCEVGEIPWIDLPAGSAEPEQPAPAMLLSAAAPPAPTTPPTPTPVPATTTVAAPSTTPPPTPAATTPTSSSAADTTDPSPTTTDSSSATSAASVPATADGASGTASESGSIVFFAVVTVVVGLGALVLWRVRRARAITQ